MAPIPEGSRPPVRVIDSLWTFAVATAVLGPLALPLLWRNPRFSRTRKIWGSLAVLVFTAGLILFAADLTLMLLNRIAELQK